MDTSKSRLCALRSLVIRVLSRSWPTGDTNILNGWVPPTHISDHTRRALLARRGPRENKVTREGNEGAGGRPLLALALLRARASGFRPGAGLGPCPPGTSCRSRRKSPGHPRATRKRQKTPEKHEKTPKIKCTAPGQNAKDLASIGPGEHGKTKITPPISALLFSAFPFSLGHPADARGAFGAPADLAARAFGISPGPPC